MATNNIKLTLEELEFPKFVNDDSKKNFRILFEFMCVDASGKPGILYAALPPLNKNNWQWRNSDKSNYVENDGKGKIKVNTISTLDRTILWEKTNIHLVSLRIVDIEDKDFLDYAKVVMKELTEIGLETVSGNLGGVFLRLFDVVKPEVKTKIDRLLTKLTDNGNKLLFKAEVAPSGTNNFLNEGNYTASGKGKKGSNDTTDTYKVGLKITHVNL